MRAFGADRRGNADEGFFSVWRASLEHFLDWFHDLRGRTTAFALKTFLFFCVVNLAFFWWALLTAYPHLLVGVKAQEYALMGFPVAVLGAVFDCVSLLITLFIAARALDSVTHAGFLAYLSVDLLLAFLAGLWVLLVFAVSGWLVSLLLSVPEAMTDRGELYQGRLQALIEDPLGRDNLRNLYFGVVMGASALFPTLFHIFLAIRSLFRSAKSR